MQRKITKTETRVRRVTINCQYNDIVDIKCGGAPILGIEMKKIKEFMYQTLKKYNRPCMGITIHEPEWIFTKAWTAKQIDACIKVGY